MKRKLTIGECMKIFNATQQSRAGQRLFNGARQTKTDQILSITEDVVFPAQRLDLFISRLEKILFEDAKNAQEILDNWRKFRALLEVKSDKIAELLKKNAVLKK